MTNNVKQQLKISCLPFGQLSVSSVTRKMSRMENFLLPSTSTLAKTLLTPSSQGLNKKVFFIKASQNFFFANPVSRFFVQFNKKKIFHKMNNTPAFVWSYKNRLSLFWTAIRPIASFSSFVYCVNPFLQGIFSEALGPPASH